MVSRLGVGRSHVGAAHRRVRKKSPKLVVQKNVFLSSFFQCVFILFIFLCIVSSVCHPAHPWPDRQSHAPLFKQLASPSASLALPPSLAPFHKENIHPPARESMLIMKEFVHDSHPCRKLCGHRITTRRSTLRLIRKPEIRSLRRTCCILHARSLAHPRRSSAS